MGRLDLVATVLSEVTGYTILQGELPVGYTGIWLHPSQIVGESLLEDPEFFDVIVIEATPEALQLKKSALMRCKTNLDFHYNNFDARGSIGVADGTQFEVGDAVLGGSSTASGTVYAISGNTLYLKNVVGTWQSAEVITAGGDSSTTTSTLTAIAFPFFLEVKLIRYDYDVDYNAAVGGKFTCWIRLEARWTL